jgi:hypothetical protein
MPSRIRIWVGLGGKSGKITMTMNTESTNINTPDTNWIDKVIRIVEILSLVLLAIPFGSIALSILTSLFLDGDYFFFFPVAMFLFFPTGIFALLVQIFRITRKHPASSFNKFMLNFSIFTVIVGIFACMAIFVVAG